MRGERWVLFNWDLWPSGGVPICEMGDLTVGCYEDGGAMPLGDVGRQERAIKDNYLQITFTFNAKTSSEIL